MDFDALVTLMDVPVRSTLGGDVLYTPGTGTAVTVRGIFDAAYQLVEVGTPGVSSVGPAVFLKLADLPTDPEEDREARITVASVEYLVHTSKPDGLGGTYLLLHTT